MRTIEFTLLISLLIIIFVGTSNVGAAAPQEKGIVRLSISLAKEAYLTREPVWLTILAVNLADTDVNIVPLKPECSDCIQIHLESSSGKVLSYSGVIFDYAPGSPHRVLLKEKDSTDVVYNLLDGFGEKVDNWPIRHFLEPGEYTVQVLYQQKVSSNILEFRVQEPQKDEQKAFQLLSEGMNDLFKMEDEKFVEKLDKLANTYPKSVYADLSYYEMAYWDKNPERKKRNVNKLVSDYPNSPYVTNAIRFLLAGKDKKTQKNILKECIAKHPGTKVEQYSRKSLEALESKKD
jgi:hypothetical protein